LAGSETLPVVQSSTTKQVSVANLTAGRLVNASAVTVTGNFISGVGGTGTAFGALYLNGGSGGGGGFIQGQQNSAATWLFGDTATALGSGTGLIEYIYSGAPKITYIQGTGEITRTVTTGLQITTGNVTMSTAAKGINFTANTPAAGMTSQLLNWYEEGTWTPTDGSGAGLSFTSVTGIYTRVGRLVTCTFGLTFPATASVASVSIGGLPFTSLSSGTPNPSGGSITYTGAAVTAAGFAVGSGGTTVALYGASGAALTNATFSGSILRAQFTYTVN
jgi:hypothetical protein